MEVIGHYVDRTSETCENKMTEAKKIVQQNDLKDQCQDRNIYECKRGKDTITSVFGFMICQNINIIRIC